MCLGIYLERHGERGLVDESPSCRVDEERPRPHLGQEVAAVERGIDDVGCAVEAALVDELEDVVEVPGGDASEVEHDGHLDGAVAAVEEGHDGAAVHGAVDGGAVDARALQVRLHRVSEVVEVRFGLEMMPKQCSESGSPL